MKLNTPAQQCMLLEGNAVLRVLQLHPCQAGSRFRTSSGTLAATCLEKLGVRCLVMSKKSGQGGGCAKSARSGAWDGVLWHSVFVQNFANTPEDGLKFASSDFEKFNLALTCDQAKTIQQTACPGLQGIENCKIPEKQLLAYPEAVFRGYRSFGQ